MPQGSCTAAWGRAVAHLLMYMQCRAVPCLLCCAVLACAVLHCAMPCCAMPCHAVPCLLCCIMLSCAVLCCMVPCYAVLCEAMLCCAVRCHVVLDLAQPSCCAVTRQDLNLAVDTALGSSVQPHFAAPAESHRTPQIALQQYRQGWSVRTGLHFRVQKACFCLSVGMQVSMHICCGHCC